MTDRFWTPERKADYLRMYEKRKQHREYNRVYMKTKRDSGEYRYIRQGKKTIFLKGNKIDEQYNTKTE